MAVRKKISTIELERLIKDEGCSQSEAARRMGVSKSAVCKHLKRLKISVARDSTLRHAGKIVEKRLDAIDQVKKINNYANELLDLLMRWNRGDGEALQILESQISTKKVKVGKKTKTINKLKMKDPRELAVKVMSEIRGQIALQFEIFQGLYDMQAVAEFQREVLTAIGEVNPDAREKIIESLKKRNFISNALELH